MVRRLKRDIVNADGSPRFVERRAGAIPVHENGLPAESNVREQVRKLRANLDETVRELAITPPRLAGLAGRSRG